MTFEDELKAISSRCRNYIKTGQISMYSKTLKEMADLFRRNGRVKDQLKMLVVSFYIDLSGFSRASFIDRELADQIQSAMRMNEMDVQQLEQLFFDWVQPDMISQHVLGVKDSWYLMRLCAEGKVEQADYVLSKI